MDAYSRQLYLDVVNEMHGERPPKPKSKWKAFFQFFKLF